MDNPLIDQLIKFAESGNQQKIDLHQQTYQGWVLEISDDALLISTGYGDKSGKEVWIQFEDLKQAALYYWDNQQSRWQSFTLIV